MLPTPDAPASFMAHPPTVLSVPDFSIASEGMISQNNLEARALDAVPESRGVAIHFVGVGS
jgi:hypothetical protein